MDVDHAVAVGVDADRGARTRGRSGWNSPQTLKAMAWWMWSPSCGTPPRSSLLPVVRGRRPRGPGPAPRSASGRRGTAGCGAARRTPGRRHGRRGPPSSMDDALPIGSPTLQEPPRGDPFGRRPQASARRGTPRRARRRWPPDRTAAARASPAAAEARPARPGSPSRPPDAPRPRPPSRRGRRGCPASPTTSGARWRRRPPRGTPGPSPRRPGGRSPRSATGTATTVARSRGRPRRPPGPGRGAGPGRASPRRSIWASELGLGARPPGRSARGGRRGGRRSTPANASTSVAWSLWG